MFVDSSDRLLFVAYGKESVVNGVEQLYIPWTKISNIKIVGTTGSNQPLCDITLTNDAIHKNFRMCRNFKSEK